MEPDKYPITVSNPTPAQKHTMDPKHLIEFYIMEDLGRGDITTQCLGLESIESRAVITINENCILAGGEEARIVFELLGASAVQEVKDGSQVESGDRIMGISGPAGAILAGERLALNMISRMSGIATATRNLNEELWKLNPNVRVAATRKTTPGFRYFEKKAVVLGGGEPHRHRLDDMVLIKDNHLSLFGDTARAVEEAKKTGFPVEVEVESMEQLEKVLPSNPDVVLLDNMTPEEALLCYGIIKEYCSNMMVEVSGGITPSNAPFYAWCADRISLSRLTTYSRPIDVTLHMA